ncbi:radical SAM protein [Kiloniella laminariae]|uniref:radical SAM protein n=1 Tax=Kiloniella laminariae TaxID=454162 RepID=UPI00037BCC92|nr:radical SAM protein [Kiloniella laminariae]
MSTNTAKLSYLDLGKKIEGHAPRVRHLQEFGYTYPTHLTLGLVTYCDQFCKGCYAGSYRFNPKIMFTASLEVLKSQLKQAASVGREYEEISHPFYSKETLGLKAVTLVGSGEPLLYPHLTQLLYYMKDELGLDIGIYTNGNNMGDKGDSPKDFIATSMLETMRFIRVSLDAASSETHAIERGVKGQFSTIIKNIENLVKRRDVLGLSEPTLGIQFTVDDHNSHEIIKIAEIAADLGVDYLAYKPKYLAAHVKTRIRNTSTSLESIQKSIDAAKEYENSRLSIHGKAIQFEEVWGEEKFNDGLQYRGCTGIWLTGYMDVDVESPDRDDANMRYFICVNKSKSSKMGDGQYEWSHGPIGAKSDFSIEWRKGIGEMSDRVRLKNCIAGCRNDPHNRILDGLLFEPSDKLNELSQNRISLPRDCHGNHL